MISRIISLACLSALILISGCAKEKITSSSDAGKKPVTITMLTHYASEQEKWLTVYIDQWNRENPDIQVIFKKVDWNQLLLAIMAQQVAGRASDILHVYSLWGGQLVENNVLSPAPEKYEKIIRDEFVSAGVKGSTINGRLYGYPTEIQAYCLYYNKKILKDSGFDNPPSTWGELLKTAKTCVVRDAHGNSIVSGFGLDNKNDASGVHPYLSMLYGAGGSLFDKNGKIKVDSKEGVSVLDLEKRLIVEGAAENGFDVLGGFHSDHLAMTINAGWWNSSLKVLMKDRYKNVGIAPVPSPDGKRKGSVSFCFFYGVNSLSKHKEEAWKFLNWLNTRPMENGVSPEGNFLLNLGINPARKGDISKLMDKLNSPTNKPFLDALDYATPEPNTSNAQFIKNTLQKAIESVWSEQLTPEQALDKAEIIIKGQKIQ